MINLAIKLRCKELKYLIKSCRDIILAEGKFRRFITSLIVLSKHLLLMPLMIPFKLFAGLILSAAVGLGIKIEERLYFDKLGELIEEYKELQKEMKKG